MNSALERAASLMNGFCGPWGVAGGWALDLFTGRQSRPHADIDIAILRSDQQELRARLPARVEKVVAGQFAPWLPGEVLELPVHEIHATWPDGYKLEFLLNEHDVTAAEWVFRRDRRVRRSLTAAFVAHEGIPCLAAEIVLLYKAKAPTTKDEADFQATWPHLAEEQKVWLAEALRDAIPGHSWARILARRA